jgi:hypothetical protein
MIPMKKHVSFFALAVGFFVGQFGQAALADEGSLTLPSLGNETIELKLPEGATDFVPAEVLSVFVGGPEACCDGRSPIAGRYRVDGNSVTFDPMFEFITGQSYTVMSGDISVGGDAGRTLTQFTLHPVDAAPVAEVIAIYPSGDAIPENTLRFYIHFSAPMQPHRAVDFIKLVDATGTPDTAAFMTFKQELWSQDRKRLTLLMDPGRIKRGVAQNLALGPALLEGETYTLVVEDGWPNASGIHQASRFEKRFSVSDPLRTVPAIENWQVTAPKTLSRDPIIIVFDRPFDRELAHSNIVVLDDLGQAIPGAVSVENHETTWQFVPLDPWVGASVQLSVDARFEDVAGNNFREILDHALGSEVQNIDHHKVTLNLLPAQG